MWFGTDNGLARFDGRRIQNFSLGEADANRIQVLKTSDTGELWIGTRAGAFVYSDNGFQPIENAKNISITAILAGYGRITSEPTTGGYFASAAAITERRRLRIFWQIRSKVPQANRSG